MMERQDESTDSDEANSFLLDDIIVEARIMSGIQWRKYHIFNLSNE